MLVATTGSDHHLRAQTQRTGGVRGDRAGGLRGSDGLGVVAESCSIPFDADARPVRTTLTQRTIAIPYADLEHIPEVIVVAGGEAKAEALRAVLRGRAVTSVVTDSAVAAELPAQEPPTSAPPMTQMPRPLAKPTAGNPPFSGR